MNGISTGDKLKMLGADERLGQNRESEYLGSEDIDPGAEPVLTIEALWNGMVTLQRGKENKDVISFVERSVAGLKNVRPLIVNSTNRKTLKKLYGSVQTKALVGQAVQLYVDHKVRDPQTGGLTDGIRIRPFKPTTKVVTVKCQSCSNDIVSAHGMTADQIAAYTTKQYGKAVCAVCASKLKQAQQTKQEAAENETDAE